MYKNANRRLAAWGAVFAAYPGLRIVHRAGRIHSNVDPLSRLIRIPPHDSPLNDDNVSIEQDALKRNIAQKAEDRMFRAAAPKAAFCIMRWEDIVDKTSASVRTRRQLAANEERELAKEVQQEDRVEDSRTTQLESDSTTNEQGDILPFAKTDPWTYPPGTKISDSSPDEDWKG